MLIETLYNLDKTPSAEPSLKRNIVPDDKNIERFTPFPWEPQLNPLCGNITPSLGLKEFGVTCAFAKRILVNLEIVISR